LVVSTPPSTRTILASALRHRPALEELGLGENPFGDEGLTALVAPPPPPAGALPPPTGVLTKLKVLVLSCTQITYKGLWRITDAGSAAPLCPPRLTAARCRRSSTSVWASEAEAAALMARFRPWRLRFGLPPN